MKKRLPDLLKQLPCLTLGMFLCVSSFSLYAEEEPFVLPDSPTPEHEKADVVYICSSKYGNISISNFNTKPKAVTEGGKTVLQTDGNSQIRLDFGGGIDVSDQSKYNYFHVDVFIKDEVSKIELGLTGENWTTAWKNIANNQSTEWISIDIPVSDFTDDKPALTLNKLSRFTLNLTSTVTGYCDNIYFYKKDNGGTTGEKELQCDLLNLCCNSHFLTIETEENMKNVYLYDIHGKIQKNLILNANNANTDISDLQSGTYIIKVMLKNGKIINQKFIK